MKLFLEIAKKAAHGYMRFDRDFLTYSLINVFFFLQFTKRGRWKIKLFKESRQGSLILPNEI